MAETKVPTKGEIQQLPRWARVAFAARCARRVLPLFDMGWPNAHAGQAEALDSAITLGEQSAATATNAVANYGNAVDISNAAHAVGRHAAQASAKGSARDVARAAANAAAAVANAGADSAGSNAAFAATYSRAAAAASAVGNHSSAAAATIRRDFNLLLAAMEQLNWTDDTPVPPEFFGPLWPEGVPEGWPRPETDGSPDDCPLCLKLEIAVPAGMSEADSKAFDAKVRDLLAAMSGFDAAMGGNGLKILDECSSEPLLAADEAPDHEDAFSGSGGAR